MKQKLFGVWLLLFFMVVTGWVMGETAPQGVNPATVSATVPTGEEVGLEVAITPVNETIIMPIVTVTATPRPLPAITNKYVKIFINDTDEETGRFAVDVTEGDPGRDDDNQKPLIYGHPRPWTSYTTVRINGKDYVFGKETAKRAGGGVPGGQIITPPVIENEQIKMQCIYDPAVVITQILDITRSPSTGAMDTARIRYLIENRSEEPVEVGIRMLLDTMVGDNDGAPFRLGSNKITYEFQTEGGKSPDFWQAFDTLTKPAVIAQGTLKGGGAVPPDRLIFTNWGKAADLPWEFPMQPGMDFVRLGEEELDSAVVMFWEPRQIAPEEEYSITTYYGLGGITFAPGNTYLGISAPSEMQYSIDTPRNYTVMMYLEHHGEAKARNVKVELTLPKGLETVDPNVILLDELDPEETKQFSWDLKPNGVFWGETSFQIKVTGIGLESNQVSRRIRIIGPPYLVPAITIPQLEVISNQWTPNPFPVILKVKNTGDAAAFQVKAVFTPESGLKLAHGEREEKYLTDLADNQETYLTWMATPVHGFKTGRFRVTLSGPEIASKTVTGEITIPPLLAQMSFIEPGRLKVRQVATLDLMAYNLTGVSRFELNVRYNPAQLKLVYASQGTFLVEEVALSQWSGGTIDRVNGTVTGINGVRKNPYHGEATSLCRLNFITVGNGEGQVEIESLKMFDADGNELPYTFTPIQYRIEKE